MYSPHLSAISAAVLSALFTVPILATAEPIKVDSFLQLRGSNINSDGYYFESGANLDTEGEGLDEGILSLLQGGQRKTSISFNGDASLKSGRYVFELHGVDVDINGPTGGGQITLISEGPTSETDWTEENAYPTSSALLIKGSDENPTKIRFNDININFITNAHSNTNKKKEELGAGTIVVAGGAQGGAGYVELGFNNSNVYVGFTLEGDYEQDNLAYGIITRQNKNSLTFNNSNLKLDSNFGGVYLEETNLYADGDIFEVNSGIDFEQESHTAHNKNNGGEDHNKNIYGLYADSNYKDYSLNFKSKYTTIIGINGVQLETYRYSSSWIGSFNVNFEGEETEIIARNTNGYFDETYAFNMDYWDPSNKEDIEKNTIEFNSRISKITNYQSANSSIDESINGSKITGFHGEIADIKFNNIVDIFAGAEKLNNVKEIIGLSLTGASSATVRTAERFSVISLTDSESAEVTDAIQLVNSSLSVNDSGIFIGAVKSGELGNALVIDKDSKAQFANVHGLLLGNIELAADISEKFTLTTSKESSNGLHFIGNIRQENFSSANASVRLNNSKDVWLVTEDTEIKDLSLANGATICLDADEAKSLIEQSQTEFGYGFENIAEGNKDFGLSLSDLEKLDTSYKHVTLSNLTADQANFRLRVNQETDSFDQITLKDNAGNITGTVDVVLSGSNRDQGLGTLADGFINQTDENANVTLGLKDRDGDGHSDSYVAQTGAVFGWKLGFKQEGSNDILTASDDQDNLVTGIGSGNWLLARTDDLPREVADAIAFGTSTAQAISWLDGLEDLRKRLGDVRHGTKSGAWAKAFASKSKFDSSAGGVEQEVSGVHIGADYALPANADSTWLFGSSFRYSNADQSGLGEATHGSSNMDEYSLKLYASYLHSNGLYADLIGQVGWFDLDINGRSNSFSDSYTADYTVFGTGASIEVGKTFCLAKDTNGGFWFIEPQAQLSYFHVSNKDYSTSTGLAIEVDSTNFVTGRLGFEAGRNITIGTEGKQNLKLALLGGLNHEFDGDSTVSVRGNDGYRSFEADDISGTRWYYGASVDWLLSENFYIYGRFEREKGNDYTKEYDFSIGARYMW